MEASDDTTTNPFVYQWSVARCSKTNVNFSKAKQPCPNSSSRLFLRLEILRVCNSGSPKIFWNPSNRQSSYKMIHKNKSDFRLLQNFYFFFLSPEVKITCYAASSRKY